MVSEFLESEEQLIFVNTSFPNNADKCFHPTVSPLFLPMEAEGTQNIEITMNKERDLLISMPSLFLDHIRIARKAKKWASREKKKQ